MPGSQDIDLLVAFHRGELSAEEEEGLRRRMRDEPYLEREYEDLQAFSDPEEVSPIAGLESRREEIWSGLREELFGTPAPAKVFWLPRLAAAVVLVSASILIGYLLGGREGDDASGPRTEVNIATLDIFGDEALRGDSEPNTARLSPRDSGLLLFLSPARLPPQGDYEVTVVDAGGREVLRSRGLIFADDTATLLIPRELLDTGSYQIGIEETSKGRRSRILQETFRVLIE